MDEFKESDETREKKSEIAKERPRDEEGHFISEEEAEALKKRTPFENFTANTTHIGRTHDDDELLDLHVGNPLKRIAQLLEDIKKQKAFSFTLKGSLGIMGVALALSIFGIFGGQKMFCEKGIQSQIGVVRIMGIPEAEHSDIPLIGPVIDFYKNWFAPRNQPVRYRTILISEGNDTIHLPYSRFVNYYSYNGSQVIATGNYDSCSKTLKVKDENYIETLNQNFPY